MSQPVAPPGYPAVAPISGVAGPTPGVEDAKRQQQAQAGGFFPGGGWGGQHPQQPGQPAPPPGAGMPFSMPTPMMMMPSPQADPESQQMAEDMAFANTTMRNTFVRKVFAIVFMQLLVTVAVACVCMYVPGARLFIRRNPGMYYAAWGIAFGVVMVISCVEKARRQFPLNVILLGVFTLAEAFLVGMITSFHDVDAVLLAFLVTCAAVAGLTIFAMNTKVDATKWGSMLGVLTIVLLVLVLAGLFFPFRQGQNKILYLAISGLAALLFSAYLIYDIQAIMGGRRAAYSPDDYVAAAMSIYLDIVQLFIAILSIIGLSNNS